MSALNILELVDYCLVLVFGLLLSTDISGGWKTKNQRNIIILMCPILLLLQGAGFQLLGLDEIKKLYPLVVHLPLVLALIFLLKKPVDVSIVSVCTAYLCCQLPRWINLAISALTHSPIIGEISYILVIPPMYWLLRRYFVGAAHDAMSHSRYFLLVFGSLPVAYYIFDYATTIYSDALYSDIYALNQFLPTAIILFYVLFLTAYHVQAQKRAQAELESSMLQAELKQSLLELDVLYGAETQAAIYRHDMRHHFRVLDGLLTTGDPLQAQEYIRKVQADLDAITPRRFCENQLVNLLCSSFMDKAAAMGVPLEIDAKLPADLSISDTELCTVLSNALENAITAAAQVEESRRYVQLYSEIKFNKLLIQVKNPYSGTIPMQDGMPVSDRADHGYGCRSIQAIAEHHHGLCTFEPRHGIFTLRVVLPVEN